MSWLVPKLPPNRGRAMVGVACLGALIAGTFGIVHDQVTYTISPEYFTRLKFDQFRWAELGLPTSVFVAEIGFLATWWVGLFAGWALARVTAPHVRPREMFRLSLSGFAIILGATLVFCALGFAYGLTQRPSPDNSAIAAFGLSLDVEDVQAFSRVAYIHNAGYLGALVGTLTAVFVPRRKVRGVGRASVPASDC
jgi:hypothetical protein